MRLTVAVIAVVAACAMSAFAQRRGQCVTPENYYGTCVQLAYCPQVANVYQQTNRQTAERYVIASHRSCGTRSVNGDPVVCCTRPATNVQPVTQRPNPIQQTTHAVRPTVVQTTTARNTRNPQTASSSPLVDVRGPYCRGPDIRDGACIALKDCPELVNELYAKQNDPSFANFLRASNGICGGTGSIICCPTNNPTTTAPVVTRQQTNGVPRRLPTVQEGCGYTKNSYKKIVGGEVSKKGAWPWIALIGYDDDLSSSPFKCGGTLVTARHVITAAHCIRNDLSFVRLGEHDLTTDTEAKHEDIKVVRKEAHTGYNRRNGRNDIAILYLERNVQFTDFVSPICLPTTQDLIQKSYVNYTPFVVGWGKTMEGGISANVLQELQIPVYGNDVCVDRYRRQNRLLSDDQFDSTVLCAGVLSGGKDTCQGDSGGPLMIPEPYQNNVRYYLIGVVSYGIGCARPEVPGVYASVQHFMDWVTAKVADTQ